MTCYFQKCFLSHAPFSNEFFDKNDKNPMYIVNKCILEGPYVPIILSSFIKKNI